MSPAPQVLARTMPAISPTLRPLDVCFRRGPTDGDGDGDWLGDGDGDWLAVDSEFTHPQPTAIHAAGTGQVPGPLRAR